MKFSKDTVYQIYPKSFNDTTGSGVGDINGIIEKLDYLKYLGIKYIWTTPFFKSPQNDNGYDIADYYAIDESFGTMEDLERLIAEAEKRDIGLMFDMVFNHTSTHNEWFKKALSGDKKYMDYYIFKEGREKGVPPTNWQSKFGGNAWEYVESLDKWYLHLFDVTQADLNWENLEVREELKNVLRFWKNKGVKGFRFDVINLISKPDKYEDDYEGDGRKFYTDGRRVHEYLKELVNDSEIGDMITVGEMSSTTIDNCIKYTNPDEKELSMCFNFHHLKVDYNHGDKWNIKDFEFMELKNLLNTWQLGMQNNNGWNAVFWCNHDQPRVVSRLGNDKEYRNESAKMLATSIHLLRGTPYVYQGEEIGMTNAGFDDIEEYRDVESQNYYNILIENGKSNEEAIDILKARSRDNSRTPMQWNSSNNAGFSEGTPWINVNKNYKSINVENQINDEDSILNYYKKLIELRKKLDVISDGKFEPLLEDNTKIFAYKRYSDNEECIVLNNFYNDDVEAEVSENLDDYELLISNYNDNRCRNEKVILRPYESIALYKKIK